MKRILSILIILSIGACECAYAGEKDTLSTYSQAPRKKVGLVLSGGGAKGVAHIGILKVLEEAGIPIDYIAGTSMGAIVGGLYSIGFSPATLDSIMRAQDWLTLLGGRVARNNLFFTEKEVSDKALFTIPFNRKRVQISTGLLSGWSVMNMLNQFTVGYHYTESFDNLPIPFACVAYDLATGEEVVMREGSLPQAIRASMSIPGAFSTVERDGAVLIDGGVINNFPADVCQAMGADLIIGVDLSMLTTQRENLQNAQLNEMEDRNSISFIVREMMDRMGKEKFEANRQKIDLYLHPDVSSYSTASFSAEAIDSLLIRGERVARENWDAIMAFKERIGLSEMDVETYHPSNRPIGSVQPVPPTLDIAEIDFMGIGTLNKNNLYRMLRIKEYSTITPDALLQALNRLKGTGSFANINYELLPNGNRYNLTFICKERSQSTFSLGVNFNTTVIAAGYLNVAFSPKEMNGSMIELDGRLSTNPYFQLGVFYQNAWVGRFGLSYRYRYGYLDLYQANDSTMHNTRFHLHRVNLDLANFYYRNFNFYLSARYEYFKPTTQLFLHDKGIVRQKPENLIVYSGGVNYDNYDNLFFPHTGIQFKANYSLYTSNFTQYKEDRALYALSASLSGAIPLSDRFTLVPSAYGRFLHGETDCFLYQNYIGGPRRGYFIEHQMPFYGLRQTGLVDNKVIAACLEARLRIGSNHYIWAKGNVARVSHTVLELIEWQKGSYLSGAAIGYSFDSPMGPLDLMLDYSGQSQKPVGFYVNFGKYF